MAKLRKKQSEEDTPRPRWQTKWPSGGDTVGWLKCMLEKCNAIDDPTKGAEQAYLAIESLVDLGEDDAAHSAVRRLMKRQPKDDRLQYIRLARLGARIADNRDDATLRERYLSQILESDQHFQVRKRDRDFSTQVVRGFRAEVGLLDPTDAVGEKQVQQATFNRALRTGKQALATKDAKQVRRCIDAMAAVAEETPTGLDSEKRWKAVLTLCSDLGDVEMVKCYLDRLPKNEAWDVLDYRMLWQLGREELAIERAVQLVRAELKHLSTSSDPNVHFPVFAICRAIHFLQDKDRQEIAERWIKRVVSELPRWPVVEEGWTTSAIYASLSETVGRVVGADAAEPLLESAYQDARQEKRNGFRAGAVRAALRAEASLGRLDSAIEKAHRIRSPSARRLELAKLFARAKRWKELKEVCRQAESADEAAELCWWIKLELTGAGAS